MCGDYHLIQPVVYEKQKNNNSTEDQANVLMGNNYGS